jgi:SAM-dependent methyltransferase
MAGKVDIVRGKFQGVVNILRLNWPFYIMALLLAAIAAAVAWKVGAPWDRWIGLAVLVTCFCVVVSLLVSWLVYDVSDLYALRWLDGLDQPKVVVNINAGFDETSEVLQQKFPAADLRVWDFFDPQQHTEPSIRRARAIYTPDPHTVAISTKKLPMADAAADAVCLFMAAHEIRDSGEREQFFREVQRVLRPGGMVYVTEHLRDLPNALAYSVGVLHFHSRKKWLRAFAQAGLTLLEERKVTPFVSTFVLGAVGRLER